MAAPLRLESFDAVPAEPTAAPADALPQAGYEDGYRAGWDDAVAAAAAERDHITADFGKALQELSFSYHEARGHVVQSVAPLLRTMAERVLPEVAHARFADTVLEAAQRLAEAAAGAPVEIRVCPENRAALEAALGPGPPLSLTLVEDDDLGPGQARLTGRDAEREVDIEPVLAELGAAISDFLETEGEESAYG
ncbi:flagellar biosynthesis/type III secretory pathway protein FliH [Rhodovulum iodosum]|uniref:Flagellar biosynthesis/type III secretory pathway protein FliH n=1 Tax=Rhodovulum iodosum TaxID=68291 RepID=A0ABV3XRG2_9RHOB|nr:flagellar biosynthesis protein [Rhodovulum robiginosum]RSK30278.1 flagellar biosynthesis protein [Rhodovulum robiginosum]